MTLKTLLLRIRAAYVELLSGAVRAARAKGQEVNVEPLIRDADGAIVRDGALESGVRLDLVVARKRGLVEKRVDSARRIGFDPITIPWTPRLSVVLEPFTWDCAHVETDLGAKALTTVVSPWLERWIAPGDGRRRGRDGLHGVVHFASDPAKHRSGAAVSLDLGSARPEALYELFDALANAGARKVRIASEPKVAAPRAR
jgi:hypothetical protein